MARGKVEPREIPSIFRLEYSAGRIKGEKRKKEKEKEKIRGTMEGIALTKIADDKMKIMRNDVRASKEANEGWVYIYIYIYRISKGRNRV